MQEPFHLVYSVRGDVRYVAVMRSVRKGGSTRKEKVLYLGRELDAERGIYKNKSLGIFAFDPLTMTCSPPPADFVDMSRRRNAREELIVDFGDAFLFSELISKYGLDPAIDAIQYGNPDSLRALLLYAFHAQ